MQVPLMAVAKSLHVLAQPFGLSEIWQDSSVTTIDLTVGVLTGDGDFVLHRCHRSPIPTPQNWLGHLPGSAWHWTPLLSACQSWHEPSHPFPASHTVVRGDSSSERRDFVFCLCAKVLGCVGRLERDGWDWRNEGNIPCTVCSLVSGPVSCEGGWELAHWSICSAVSPRYEKEVLVSSTDTRTKPCDRLCPNYLHANVGNRATGPKNSNQ